MNRFLSKISAPLLLGSILALSAMAWPGHADAGEPARFIFRHRSGLLPMQVAAVPEDGDDADEQEPTGTPHLRLSFTGGWVFECETAWTSAFVAENYEFLTTQFNKPLGMGGEGSIIPAGTTTLEAGGNATFPFVSAWLFVFLFDPAAETAHVLKNTGPGPGYVHHPREGALIGDRPAPCLGDIAAIVGRGPASDFEMYTPRTIGSVGIVYR